MTTAATDTAIHLAPLLLRLAQQQASDAGITLSAHIERLVRAYETQHQAGESVPRGMAESAAPMLVPSASVYRQGSADPGMISSLIGVGHPGSEATPVADEPGVLRIAAFSARVAMAALLLSTASNGVAAADRPGRSSKRDAGAGWYARLIDESLEHVRQMRAALLRPDIQAAASDPMVMRAFALLTELSPAGPELKHIARDNRPRAFAELAAQLDFLVPQIRHAAGLVGDAGSEVAAPDPFARARATLIEQAGGGVSLTEAASLLGVTRQAVHKRIKAGVVLAMMDGHELVLPRAQFIQADTGVRVVTGLSDTLPLFESAGPWSALQFLVESDPNLGNTPLQVLTEGRTRDVVDAAKAYLGLDDH